MKGRDVFNIWAPIGAKWTDWVRPVPFVAMDDNIVIREFNNYHIPTVDYLSKLYYDTIIIVDIPSYNGVMEGLALAKLGYRPIPVYNGTNEQDGVLSTTNNRAISFALLWGSNELKNINLTNDAPPVFLLDTNRLNRYKMDISVFDNSWDIYPQDLPSAQYLVNNGINKVIVKSDKIHKDLNKILYEYQKNKIKILFTNGDEKPKKVTVRKSIFKSKA